MSNRVHLPDKDGKVLASRKKKSKERIIERYLGKKDLLATWEQHPHVDRKYRNNLKVRVRHHHQELIYRGNDNEVL